MPFSQRCGVPGGRGTGSFEGAMPGGVPGGRVGHSISVSRGGQGGSGANTFCADCAAAVPLRPKVAAPPLNVLRPIVMLMSQS